MSVPLKTSRFFICCGLLGMLLLMVTQGNSPRRSIAADPAAVVTLVEGDGAKVRTSSSASWKPTVEDMELPVGAEVRTDADSRVEIQLEDDSIIRLDSLSSIRIVSHTALSKKFKADQGKLWLKINKIAVNSTFEVETPTIIAGVRGTTFRIDVGGEGDAETGDEVSVEDGEIEVRHGDNNIRIGRMMKTRFMKGRIENPSRFDPDKLKRWEKWTEKHVAARFDNLRNEAESFHEKARAIASEGKAVATDALRLLKEIRTATVLIEKNIGRTARLREQTDRLLAASNSRPERPGGGKGDRGGGNKPGRPQSGSNEKLKEKAKTLLVEVGETEFEIEKADSSFSTIRENILEINKRAKIIKEAATQLRANRERLTSNFEKNRRRRKLDPQWAQLRDVSAKIEENEKGISENAAQIDETLAGRMLESKDKTRNLMERLEEFSQQIETYRSKTNEAAKELDSIRRDLNTIINK